MHKIYLNSSLIFLFILSFLISQSSAFAEEGYKIGSGDILDITVWNEPNLTKVITVGKQGNINLPLLGEFSVDGLTCKEIEETMVSNLKEGGYILSPQVNVLVKEYKSKKIMVFGLTNKPGIHYLKRKTDILELISDVGIDSDAGTILIHRGALLKNKRLEESLLTQSIENSSISSIQEDDVVSVDLHALLVAADLSQNVEVKSGDIMYVTTGTKHTVYVLGEVKNPGPYSITKGLTLLGAIEKAGSFTQFAAANRIKILREIPNSDEKETIKIRMKDIKRGDKSKDIELIPGDVIVVPESWI